MSLLASIACSWLTSLSVGAPPLLFLIDSFVEIYLHSQHFGEEGFETYGTTFYTIFTFFVSGLEETTGPLDLIFGILSVIILLNVVIAIVSASWESAVESSLILLW